MKCPADTCLAPGLSRRTLAAALAAFTLPLTARAAEFGTPDEAKAMAEKAAAVLREKGLDDAIKVFAENPGPFRDRDLYVFVWRDDGMVMFHATQPALIGRNMIDMKDVKGTPLSRNFIAVKDAAWVDYYWPNPQTKVIQAKGSYIIAVAQYRVGVGAYKTQPAAE
jgi:signal transduction histidine kinase